MCIDSTRDIAREPANDNKKKYCSHYLCERCDVIVTENEVIGSVFMTN